MHASFNSEDDAYLLLPQSRDIIEQYLLLYDSDDIEDSVNLDFQVLNSGHKSSGDFTVRFYLSADNNITSSDVYLTQSNLLSIPPQAPALDTLLFLEEVMMWEKGEGTYWMAAETHQEGLELYRTDGTKAGTQLVDVFMQGLANSLKQECYGNAQAE